MIEFHWNLNYYENNLTLKFSTKILPPISLMKGDNTVVFMILKFDRLTWELDKELIDIMLEERSCILVSYIVKF